MYFVWRKHELTENNLGLNCWAISWNSFSLFQLSEFLRRGWNGAQVHIRVYWHGRALIHPLYIYKVSSLHQWLSCAIASYFATNNNPFPILQHSCGMYLTTTVVMSFVLSCSASVVWGARHCLIGRPCWPMNRHWRGLRSGSTTGSSITYTDKNIKTYCLVSSPHWL